MALREVGFCGVLFPIWAMVMLPPTASIRGSSSADFELVSYPAWPGCQN